MSQNLNVVSKVLVHDGNKSAMDILKSFCEENHLIGLRAKESSVVDVLKSNIELGAICLSEEADEHGQKGVDLAVELHKLRSEVPIFLRRKNLSSLDDLPGELRKVFAGAYQLSEMNKLKELVNSYLFSQHFPNALVRGITELSVEAFNAVFHEVDIQHESPYIVKDKLIYGELFSLLHIDSHWARGYMMHQAEEAPLMRLVQSGNTKLPAKTTDFRSVNMLLSEIANLIWGRFKTRFVNENEVDAMKSRVQVPIIVHHGRQYITFGSDDPQLCFKYVVRAKDQQSEPVTILQKFAFSLSWTPEKFQENQQALDQFIEGGELELF